MFKETYCSGAILNHYKNKVYMKLSLTLKDYIFIGIILVLTLLLIFHKSGNIQVDTRQRTIDSLTNQISQRDIIIKQFDKDIIALVDSASKLKTEVKINDVKIKNIYHEYTIKIKSVDDYDVDQLERFFSERYDTDSTQ